MKSFNHLNSLLKVQSLISYFMSKRNKIIDNPLKYFNPFYNTKLKLLDYHIDNLIYIREYLENIPERVYTNEDL